MINKPTIVIVGDIINDSNYIYSIFDEDNPTKDEVELLKSYLNESGYTVDIIPQVHEFVNAVPKNKNIIVFPLWRGGASRNRTAIVPSVCEINKIKYIGADAFGQTVCQDKSLSKCIAQMVGIDVPKEVVLLNVEEIQSFYHSQLLEPPFVIKPLYSACSIGIDQNSLCYNLQQAQFKAKKLFEDGLGPVVCEEFIVGEEVSACYIEQYGEITENCVSIYLDDNGRCPFNEHLFTFEDKINEHSTWRIDTWKKDLGKEFWRSAKRLTSKLGKVDYMRIDGKISNGRFILIEFTPDIHLSLNSLFLGGFNSNGLPPNVILDKLVQTSINNQLKVPLNG